MALVRRALKAVAWFAAIPLGLGLLELCLRQLNPGHAALPIYASLAPPTLIPGVSAVGRLGARTYPVEIDARGLRAPSAPAGTVLLGDSLAFGMGLPGEESLAARCTALGRPTLNGAAPSFSAVDALERGDALAPLANDFLLVLNPWDDAAAPLADHARAVNGWLLRRDAPAWITGFFASRFASWQLPHDGVRLLSLLSPAPEPQLGWAEVGARIRSFVDHHPKTQVVWGGFPTPTTPDGREVAAMRAELGVPTIELALHDAWLDGDLHWSASGVAQVAAQLCGP